MEDGFSFLIERLGFRIDRRREQKTGLDIITHFEGEPLPKHPRECKLLRPCFMPTGTVVISVKRGDISNSDINEVIDYTKNAKATGDDFYQSVDGIVIVTNYTKTEGKLNDISKKKNIFCWDGRRLIFYAAKARYSQELALKGRVLEERIDSKGYEKFSYLIQTQTGNQVILANIVVLLDEHDPNFSLGADHIKFVLKYIYDTSLKPMVKANIDIQAAFTWMILGIADKDLVTTAYNDYSGDESQHPKVTFSSRPQIFLYGAAPWANLLINPSWIG
jgi:hypothetical protein